LAKAKKPEEQEQANVQTEAPEAPETPVETAEAVDGVKLTREEFDQVKAHIETLQKERDEAVNLAQRLQADFDNYRKRNATLRADSHDDGVRDCIKELLPVLDNFDRALACTEGVEESFLEGMKLVQRTLLDALQKQGMSEVPAEGAFDPNLHNAVLQEPAEGVRSGDILAVLQKGYEVKGRILRHTMVKVAQ